MPTIELAIEALNCCIEGACKRCPLLCGCKSDITIVEKFAVDVIKQLKAENKNLNNLYNDALESVRLAAEANKDMSAEIKRLEIALEIALKFNSNAETDKRLANIELARLNGENQRLLEIVRKVYAECNLSDEEKDLLGFYGDFVFKAESEGGAE